MNNCIERSHSISRVFDHQLTSNKKNHNDPTKNRQRAKSISNITNEKIELSMKQNEFFTATPFKDSTTRYFNDI